MMAGNAAVFFAVFGFDAMSTAAEKQTYSKKHMPKANIFSLVIVRLPYAAVTPVLASTQNHRERDTTVGFLSESNSVELRISATITRCSRSCPSSAWH